MKPPIGSELLKENNQKNDDVPENAIVISSQKKQILK